MPAAVPAIPPKPSMAAISAIAKSPIISLIIMVCFLGVVKITDGNTLSICQIQS